MTTCNVLIVDDHPLMRKGITQLLSFEEEFHIIGEASNGSDALAIALKEQPDLILLDLNMKGMSGLDTLKAFRAEGIEARIVVLSVSDSPSDIDTMVKAGADGYLLKDTEPDELIELIKDSLSGNKIYSDEVRKYLNERTNNPSIMDLLTDREHQILKEVAKGFRNKQIADNLFISESTVKVHMKSLLKKLEVPSRTAATILYLEHFGDPR
ncbi:Nitrate/nitrite response regulator protein narP [Vibrio nigripulchritudo SO65]|uniref:response regulator n=1 Tax=Vibrio nigripulchritudo TaxID=28173 RepID=UPI0003B24451|nr:response regulator [Vibrio nigripulchritudo]CCN37660.1 Nitrate/nitrite response regulator protein narP [Vibrio nigripulchritudo AM115]CCN41153.1 Nitrate/nitrite response regulator protein narP [Vibrio nigripulchritudo FTn2]CCN67576.1 Nitrate/nitrite response regulator protein narP [Vibrio nigripulchritudo POn4]CCN76281.1 Nitrate/nitrite response regulator protein narP [Vibrio nigripulchritudo SO65]